jgi:hypothetical protein
MTFPVSPTNGQVTQVNGITYIFNSTDNAWTRSAQPVGNLIVTGNTFTGKLYTSDGLYWAGNGNVIVTGGAGGGVFTASNTAPASPAASDFWYYIAGDILFQYINDGDTQQWVDIISPVAPSSTVVSSLVLANVSISSVYNINSTKTALGIPPTVSSTAPANPIRGDLWYDTDDDITYQYVFDGVGNAWVDISSAEFGFTNNSSALMDTVITGNLVPSANIIYSLGTSTNRFKDLWLAGNTLFIGGANISTDGSNVTISNPSGGSFTVAGSTSGNANVSFGNVFGNYYFANGAAFSSSSFGNTDVAAYLRSSTGLGSNTDAIVLPVGTTEQRPTATNGMMRYNSSINGGSIEAYLGGNWVTIASANYQVGFLIIAGGGGGGGRIGAGGGAGGVLVGNIAQSVIPGSSYTVVIGAGGTAGAAQQNGPGGDGGNSSVFSFVAVGGGGGAGTDSLPGRSGGSGGGGSRVSLAALGGATTQLTPPSGLVTAYGNAGGAGSGAPDRSGGGGGAGAAGATGTASGNGGNGIVNPIPGSTVGQLISTNYWIAGGGGGSAFSNPATGSGGNGGGGAGNTSAPGTAGTAATGGGGGGGGYPGEPGLAGGAGGSGAVVIYYVSTTQRGAGGTVTSTTVGSTTYYLHTFTSTGTFTFTAQ